MIIESLKKYIFLEKELFDGHQIIFKFPNGYGASIINHGFSYGLELAVIYFLDNENTWSITYNTPITDDVLGHLDEGSAIKYLYKIKNLEVLK